VEEFGATSKCHLDTSSQEVGLVTVGFGTKHKPFGPFANPKGNRVKKKGKRVAYSSVSPQVYEHYIQLKFLDKLKKRGRRFSMLKKIQKHLQLSYKHTAKKT
jgi:hypothetical protein